MSLRTRLVAGLLLVSALGLVLLGAITYAEQRDFLLDRIDDQLRAAPQLLERELDAQGIGASGLGEQSPEGPNGPSGDDGEPVQVLPPGTYGELRSASGRALGHIVVTYGQETPAAPKLPSDLESGEVLTVDAKGDSDVQYRVAAFSTLAGTGTLVVAIPLTDVDRTLDRLLLVETIVILGVLLALGAVGAALVRIGLRPLDRMAATAGQIAAGDLDRRVSPASSRTEVGRLGLALNSMLERLEGAFAQREASEGRLRRFISDASHELRTPLASIRGYAELYRLGAAASEEDTRKALARIEHESARMGVLVDDLLTLARLDETPEPKFVTVDLAALAQDAADDARATAPSRRIEVQAEGPATVLGDEYQLRQVLANLMRNALTHTPEGTAVEIGVEGDGDRVKIEVRDEGPGLPPGDPAALFERFWRSEGGRERGRAGSGLGLAIVAAIVSAHHGEVSASDRTPRGAVFTVALPRAP